MLNEVLKYGRTVLISFLCGVFVGGAIAYFICQKRPPLVVSDGKVEYIEKIVYKVTTNTGACCSDYNSLLADYNIFMSAPPIYISSDDKRIYFSIVKNRYSMAYETRRNTPWTVSPMIGVSLAYDNVFTPTLCGGVTVQYDCIGASLIVSSKNVSLLGSFRFEIK